MKKIKMIYPIAVALSLLMMMNCKSRITDFTIISTKNVDLTQMASYKRGTARVEGEDKMKVVLFFIPIQIKADLKEAIDKALHSVPGAVGLVDGVVYQTSLWAFVYWESGFLVEGTPLINPKQAALSQEKPKSEYAISVPDAAGNFHAKYFSKDNFEKIRSELRANNAEQAKKLMVETAIN